MKYEFVGTSTNGRKVIRMCDDPRCLPNSDTVEAMYRDGHRLYVDGKKVGKEEALKLVGLKGVRGKV